MPNPATYTVGNESAPQASAQAAIVRNPFVRAAHQTVVPFDDRTTAIGASAAQVGPISIPAQGFLRGIILEVATDGTGSGGSAAAAGDAPWNALTNIVLTDTNGRPLVGPLGGYDLYLINKYGGYAGTTMDPASYPSYSAVSANGEFAFRLRIPVEITSRDALGCLPNLTSAATYRLEYYVNAEGTIYSTAPVTTTPALNVKCYAEVWSQPMPTAPDGVPNETMPPAVGTIQYWSKSVVNITAGEQRIQFNRMGNHVRNWILAYYNDSSPSVRNTTEIPSTWRVEWDAKILTSTTKTVEADYQRERYGFNYDTGVTVLGYTHDADGVPGNENRHLWIPTVAGTRFELIGTWGGSGTLVVLTNDVQVAGQVRLSSGNPGN